MAGLLSDLVTRLRIRDLTRFKRLGVKRLRPAVKNGDADLVAQHQGALQSYTQRIEQLPSASPAFLIIGAARAGSSWLKNALSGHPNIFVPPGEPQFFQGRMAGGVENYLRTLAKGPHKGGKDYSVALKLYGEKSPGYLPMPEERIRIVAEHFPTVRLICLTREPIARARSHVVHFKRANMPPRMNMVIASSCYVECLSRWRRHFRADQFLILDFDRISTEPEEIYREAIEFIGAPWVAPKASHMGKNTRYYPPSVAEPLDQEIEDRLRHEPFRAKDLVGIPEAMP